MRLLFFVLSFLLFLPSCATADEMPNEDGYSLWLRYLSIDEPDARAHYAPYFEAITLPGESPTLDAIKKEFALATEGFFSKEARFASSPGQGNGIELVLVQPADPGHEALSKLNRGAYEITSDGTREKVTLRATSEEGLLYGTFHLTRLVQSRAPLDGLAIRENPKLDFRMLNQWDNLNGTVERGYSGGTIYKWDELPETVDPRYEDFARANASIGINAICINSVNADPNILRPEYLEKVSKIADLFRPYKIQVFLSPNFSAPMEPSSTPHTFKKWGGIGELKTNDPLDGEVIAWWESKVAEIYEWVPDFGGFVVKANSEGMPGPQDYGRTHAEGANMFASLLEPYDGIVVWRAFVYAHGGNEPDRVKQAYQEFFPLDGEFNDNVFVQIKNGPLDFQPSEPAHPLFGAMTDTYLMPELQITQEYLGHSTYLVYLGPLWEDFLRFDTHSPHAAESRVEDIIQTPRDGSRMTGMAGVANAGDDRNWTGHHFAQANWYLFGRLAWNPNAAIDPITREWITMTWATDEETVETIKGIMDSSWKSFTDLQTPFGLPVTVDYRLHYLPALSVRNNSYWRADEAGIGYDHSSTGSDYVSQYFPRNRDAFDSIESCPDDLLLFFHFVEWDTPVGDDGTTFYEHFMQTNRQSVEQMRGTLEKWRSLEGKVDARRHSEVLERLEKQVADATVFHDSYVEFIHEARGGDRPAAR